MADQPQPQSQQALPRGLAGPYGPKKSFVGKLASSVASHAYMALAIIVVLAILVIGLYVYYHGFLVLGPYAKGRPGDRARRKKKEGMEGGGGDPNPAEERGDAETERLIDSINRQ